MFVILHDTLPSLFFSASHIILVMKFTWMELREAQWGSGIKQIFKSKKSELFIILIVFESSYNLN